MGEQAQMATAIAGKQMELEGTLGAFQLPDVMRFLAMGSMTGVLTLTNADRIMGLIIKEGRLIGTTSPNRMLKLGQLLISSAAIRRRDLEEVLECQRDDVHGTAHIGEMLIQRGLVTTEQVSQALELQAKEEVWEALSWTEGNFKFEHGLTPSMTRGMFSIEIGSLLDEGAERMEQWREIDRNLRDTDRVYRVRGDIAAIPETRLKPNTWRVLSLLNGQRSLKVMIYLCGLGKFETLCAIDNLLSMQLIEPVESVKMPKMEVKAPEPAQSPSSAKDEGSEETPGLLGLFGRRRRTPSTTAESVQLYQGQCGPFLTSVGFGCALLNRLSERLGSVTQTDDLTAQQLLTQELWAGEGLRYQRADLIEWRDGRLDSSRFDQYMVHAGSNTRHMIGCLEDSMAALAAVGREMVRRADGIYGPRAERMIQDVTRYFCERVDVGWPGDFSSRGWIQQWIKGE